MQKWLHLALVCLLAAVIGLPRFLALDAHWSSDETTWLKRSRQFMVGVLERDFEQTRPAYHPGVTTMWLGGLALHGDYGDRLSFPEQFLTLTEPDTLSRTRFGIALVTVISILLAYALLRRLLGPHVAVIGAFFLACDPLFLAQSRRLHTDALAANFLLLALLTLLLYLENPERLRTIGFCGVALGLALLSKSYSLVFVLFLPLAFLAYARIGSDASEATERFTLRSSIYAMLALLGAAGSTVMALWPATWVLKLKVAGWHLHVSVIAALGLLALTIWCFWRLRHPQQRSRATSIVEFSALGVVGLVGIATAVFAAPAVTQRIWWALTTEHKVPQLFLGKVVQDPGWAFYLIMLTIKTAPLTLPLSVVGLVIAWRSRDPQYDRVRRISLALVVFAVLFLLCQSIGAKKFNRYALPAYLPLDILAAIGTLALFERGYRLVKHRWLAAVSAALFFAIVMLAQAVPVLRLHPYYGSYYSPVWKFTDPTQVYLQGDGFGLDIAGRYLSQKPGAHRMSVRTSPLAGELFRHYFPGRTYRWEKNPMNWKPDYDVVYIRDTQIGRQNAELEGLTPEKVIKVNGMEYVWIYPSARLGVSGGALDIMGRRVQ